jgi:16S rRNA (guanine966-N2)-methyltransferase
MRVITGKFKGRNINMPKGIRPTQNKVRKALFDILGDIEGSSFLDLYAGSGAVGLEALSKGASQVIFVEKDKRYTQIIKKNLRFSDSRLPTFDSGSLPESNIQHRATVITMDALRAISLFTGNRKKFDIVFIDPPYYRDLAKKTLKTLSRCDIVSHYGLIICQHYKKDKLPETAGDLRLIKQSRYGDTLLSFYQKIYSGEESNKSKQVKR